LVKDNGNANRWLLALTNTGALVGVITAGISDEVSAVTPNGSIPLNQWSHVAFTYRRGASDADSILTIFINGTPSATANKLIGVQANVEPLRLGNDNGSGGPANLRNFDGLIDEPAVYNRALSQTEIQSIFDAESAGKCKPTATVAPNNLVGWWAGDGNANDISGNNLNGTLNAPNGFAVGKTGQSFVFSSLPALIVNDNPVLNQQNFTIEAWVTTATYSCPLGPNTCQAFIVAKSGLSANSGYEIGARENGKLRFSLNGAAGGADVLGNANIADGNFHHVVASYDSATVFSMHKS